jgi:hypothetical protein
MKSARDPSEVVRAPLVATPEDIRTNSNGNMGDGAPGVVADVLVFQ